MSLDINLHRRSYQSIFHDQERLWPTHLVRNKIWKRFPGREGNFYRGASLAFPLLEFATEREGNKQQRLDYSHREKMVSINQPHLLGIFNEFLSVTSSSEAATFFHRGGRGRIIWIRFL